MTPTLAVHDLIELGWRDVDRLLAEHVPSAMARVAIGEKILSLRTAERLECSLRLTAMDERVERVLFGGAR